MKPSEPHDAKAEHHDNRPELTPRPPDVGQDIVPSASSPELGNAPGRRNDASETLTELRAREVHNTYLDAKYDVNIRELRSEMAKLQDVLENSGPLRLGWLKLTRQISVDPHRDLNTLSIYAEKYEQERAEELKSFEDQKAERRIQEAALVERRRNEARLLRTMGPDEALDIAEALMDEGHAPMPELLRRAGVFLASKKVGDVMVPGFNNDNLPRDLGPVSEDADFGVDFEPPF